MRITRKRLTLGIGQPNTCYLRLMCRLQICKNYKVFDLKTKKFYPIRGSTGSDMTCIA